MSEAKRVSGQLRRPDDKADRLEAERKAKIHGPALLEPRLEELKKLLTVYTDATAEELLRGLREWFWTEVVAQD